MKNRSESAATLEFGLCPVCRLRPLLYKRLDVKFCPECDRSFDAKTGAQVANLAWGEVTPGRFAPRFPKAQS